MNRSAKAALVVACLTVFTHTPAVLAEEVSIAGSTAMAESLILPNRGAIEMRAGQDLSVHAVRSLRGFHGLVRGDVDIAMISAPLSEMIAQLEAAAPEALENQALVALPIRGYRVAFVVHPSNPLRSLSAEAVGKVLTGEVTNWKALGGPDRPIETVMQQSGSGIRGVVERGLASRGGALAATHEVLTLNQVVWMVSVSPNAIGVATVEAADNSVVRLHSDLVLDQSMYLVTRDRAGQATEDVFEAAAVLFGSTAEDTSVAAAGKR